MASPLFSIGGLASGLDTTSIIGQLMQLERRPISVIQQRQAQLRQVDQAWGQVVTKLSAVRGAVDGLAKTDALSGLLTLSSSQSDAVGATRTTGATPSVGSYDVSVSQLAAAHQLVGDTVHGSADALVGAGDVTLTLADGSAHVFSADGSTTLQDLAGGITGLGAGVTARVVKTSDSGWQLAITANRTGAASGFTVSGAPVGATQVARQAADAKLTVDGVAVTRSTNTITDLVDGVTLNLTKPTSSSATVTVAQDVEAAVTQVKGFVDALASALTTLKDLSAYDADSKKAGVLQGNRLVRQLQLDLRGLIASELSTGTAGDHAGTIGIALTRDGGVVLDEAKLRAAITADPGAVERVLSGRTGSATDARAQVLSVTSPTSSAQSGTYAVEITAAATTAQNVGTAAYVAPAAAQTFTVSIGGKDVGVTVDAGMDITAAVGRINDALAAQGVSSLQASVNGSAIKMTATSAGSAHSFSVAGSGDVGLDGTYNGTDVAGTIGGEAATGNGETLTAAGASTKGLVLRVTATQADVDAAGGNLALGSVTVSAGLSGGIDAILKLAEGSRGTIAGARETLSGQIRRFDDQIAAFEIRLASREKTLRQKFAAMEMALSRSQEQGNWLASQIASMNPQ